MAAAFAALLGGCKNNTSSAATPERRVGKPPVVRPQFAQGPLCDADPVSSPVWRAAAWWALAAPANTARTTAPAQGAVLFDEDTLYVAVINDLPPFTDADSRDAVALFLDTKGEGKELLQVTVDSSGQTQCAWIRTGAAIEPLADGSPNLGYPLDVRPNYPLAGLGVQVRQGVFEGRPVWTAVLAVPVAGMPALMQVLPAKDTHWKFNVLRMYMVGTGSRGDVMQANLSPVYVGAQAVSPYRMAELDFAR
jgi:hypothetical protein